jgi:hypothetical protein
MSDLEISSKYIVTNAFSGPTKALVSQSTSDQISIDSSADPTDTKRQWYMSVAEYAGFYRLHTTATGDSKSLDVLNDNGVNSITLQFATSGLFTGQFWRFDKWDDGTYRLSNNFTGVDKHLDVYSNTLLPYLGTGDLSGQHWTFSKYAASSSSSSSSASSSSLSSKSSGSSQPASSSSIAAAAATAPPNTSSGLSAGAIAGIAIGAVAALALLIGVVVFAILHRRRRSPEDLYQYPSGTSHDPKKDFAAVNQGPVYPSELPGEPAIQRPVEMPAG